MKIGTYSDYSVLERIMAISGKLVNCIFLPIKIRLAEKIVIFQPQRSVYKPDVHRIKRTKTMKFILFLFALINALSCSNNTHDYTVLKDCTIIPMNKDTILPMKNIIIQANRIVAIEDSIDTKYINSKTTVIDCNNKFVIPGLFDSHFHYGRNESLYKLVDSLLLHSGVTNVFSFHGSDELLSHRRKIDRAEFIGPKIISTGRNQNEEHLTKEEAIVRLKNHKEKGFEFVKIYTHLSEAAFEVYNNKAKDYNLRLVGHIPRKLGFYQMMNTEQDLISHAEEILYNEPINYLMGVDDAVTEPQYELIDTIVATVKENNKWVSPTLVTFKSILTQAQGSEFPSGMNNSLKELADHWNWLPPENQIPSKFNTVGKKFRLEKGFLFLKLLVKEMNKQNVSMLAGTDSPSLFNLTPGRSLHKELQLLNACEISAYETLKMATINPAQFLQIDNEYGTIEINKVANLIILNKNPLLNIKNTEEIYKVLLNGKQI